MSDVMLSDEYLSWLTDEVASGRLTPDEAKNHAAQLMRDAFAQSRSVEPPNTEPWAKFMPEGSAADVHLARTILTREGFNRNEANEILLRPGGIESLADQIAQERKTEYNRQVEQAKSLYALSHEGLSEKAKQLLRDEAILAQTAEEARILLKTQGGLPDGALDEMTPMQLAVTAGLLPDPDARPADTPEANAEAMNRPHPNPHKQAEIERNEARFREGRRE